jgi:peroxiredoxin Q/BCP
MLNVGDEAPDFSATDHNGNTITKSDFAGKTVVLWYYPKACTGG